MAGGFLTLMSTGAAAELTSRVARGYGQLPLMFEPAGNDATAAAHYFSRGPGYSLCLQPHQIELWLLPRVAGGRGPATRSAVRPRDMSDAAAASRGEAGARRLRLCLLAADAGARGVPELPLPTRVNYFQGNDPSGWRTNVCTYGRVRYPAIYAGVDVVFYGNQGELEYDFVVAPGADPGQVRVRLEGADQVEVSAAGDLVVRLGAGELRFARPVIYQPIDGRRVPVAGGYELAPGPEAVVGFKLARYDTTQPLVIDPVLAYSTYLGGQDYDLGNGMAVDTQGQVYITGSTASTNFPVKHALWRRNNGGSTYPANPYGNDAFVAKLDATGTNLVFATYLGGSGVDGATAVAVDSQGNAYLTGYTGSGDFPVTPTAFAKTNSTDLGKWGIYLNDVFVTKLSPDGAQLLYSTYVGGEDDDLGLRLAVDGNGAIYVTGNTRSKDFPVRNSTASFGGENDAFVFKLLTSPTDLRYSVLLGGGEFDLGQSIAVDRDGNALVTGETGSASFPVTNAFQTQFRGGTYDAFVVKLGPDGAPPVYATFLGGQDLDEGFGIATDAQGNAYVTGYTASGDFPITNALYATRGGGRDAFVAKLGTTGALERSTFLGGNSDEEAWSVALDPAGRIWLAGSVQSGNFPTTNAVQSARSGSRDAFVTQLDAAAGALLFSSYLGGSKNDEARALAIDVEGNVYLTGYTTSFDFPLVPRTNALQRGYGGGGADAFVTKLYPGSLSVQAEPGAAGSVVLSWPGAAPYFQLQSKNDVTVSNAWTAVTNPPVLSDDRWTVIVTNPVGHTYFRLRSAD